jgi:ribosomal protein S12 methylthiotransferase accessory factor
LPLELADCRETPTAESLRRLDSLVSPYVGVVRSARELLAEPDDVRLLSILCDTGYAHSLVGGSGTHAGAGSGAGRAAARAAAIGEAVERYSACFTGDGHVLATADELGASAVDPRRFALFHRGQHARPGFPYAPFARGTRVAWVRGWSLPDGEDAYLPAQLVYLAWRLLPGEVVIGQSTSNGLACRASLGEAILTGLLELLERDAFMITWNARLTWPRLVWRRNRRLCAFERRYVEPTGLRVRAIDLSAFWNVPCALGVVRSSVAGEAPVGVGAGAAPTIERAVEKALDEALRVRSWARSIRGKAPNWAGSDPRVRTFEDHVRFYAYDENTQLTTFLDGSGVTRDVHDVSPLGPGVSATIRALCERLAGRSASAYAVDVTAPDVRAAGLRVVKVVSPELCALDVDHEARQLGGRRLYDEPVRLGMSARTLTLADVNPAPHPFP